MSSFSAAAIPRFSAIFVRHEFRGDPEVIRKWFIILKHVGSAAICLKTTHHTKQYENDPIRMAGCVYFKAGTIGCFPLNTVVPPDNYFAIRHSMIEADEALGRLKIHAMPTDFRSMLEKAVKDHDNLSGKERVGFAEMLK